MPRIKSKVFLESAKPQATGGELYRVVRLVNTTDPRIGATIDDYRVEEMIAEGIDVTISPGKERPDHADELPQDN